MTAEQRTAEEQQIAANVRVSMINVTPAGTVAVGFTDNSVNPPENHYLAVGRSQNGWTVKSADPASESVTLEKEGVSVTVKLGENAGKGNAKAGVKGSVNGGGLMTLRSRGGVPAHSPQAANEQQDTAAYGGFKLGGLERLRRHRAEMRAKAQAEADKKAQADAVAAAEREERAAREAEEKRQRDEREAREAEDRAQQREALRQIQEQLRKAREERDAAARQRAEEQENQGDANNVE